MLADDDLTAMQALASRCWSRRSRHHAGQLAWSARYAEHLQHGPLRVVDDGWAWAEDAAWLEVCVDPAASDPAGVAAELVTWFVAAAPDGDLRTMVLASEHHLLGPLADAGFAVIDDAPWFTHHHLDLARLPAVAVPDGYALRPVRPGEAAPRAACHRRAWESTRMTTAAYERLMATAPYRPDLDWVAVAPGGAWVASCCVWLDPATGVALVEPVGCAPEHRRRGLAAAVSLAALIAARDAGAVEALVCPRGDDGYPVPQALYRGLGFEPGERTVTLVRRRPS